MSYYNECFLFWGYIFLPNPHNKPTNFTLRGDLGCLFIEIEMSFWQLPMQPVMKIWSKFTVLSNHPSCSPRWVKLCFGRVKIFTTLWKLFVLLVQIFSKWVFRLCAWKVPVEHWNCMYVTVLCVQIPISPLCYYLCEQSIMLYCITKTL